MLSDKDRNDVGLDPVGAEGASGECRKDVLPERSGILVIGAAAVFREEILDARHPVPRGQMLVDVFDHRIDHGQASVGHADHGIAHEITAYGLEVEFTLKTFAHEHHLRITERYPFVISRLVAAQRFSHAANVLVDGRAAEGIVGKVDVTELRQLQRGHHRGQVGVDEPCLFIDGAVQDSEQLFLTRLFLRSRLIDNYG